MDKTQDRTMHILRTINRDCRLQRRNYPYLIAAKNAGNSRRQLGEIKAVTTNEATHLLNGHKLVSVLASYGAPAHKFDLQFVDDRTTTTTRLCATIASRTISR